MAENKVTRYADYLDDNMNTELYLIPEQEITEEQYAQFVEYLGVTGPGRQFIEKDGKFYLKSDEDPEAALARAQADLVDKGVEPVNPNE